MLLKRIVHNWEDILCFDEILDKVCFVRQHLLLPMKQNDLVVSSEFHSAVPAELAVSENGCEHPQKVLQEKLEKK